MEENVMEENVMEENVMEENVMEENVMEENVMKGLDEIFCKLIAGECEISAFEKILYSNPEFEVRLSESDYLDLISLDYSAPSAVYDARRMAKKYMDSSRYREWLLKRILTAIVDRVPGVHGAIVECYYLYCKGFRFMCGLGLRYGLSIISPPSRYSADEWHELTDAEQEELIDSMHPEISNEAQRVLKCMRDGTVIVTGGGNGCEEIRLEYLRPPARGV